MNIHAFCVIITEIMLIQANVSLLYSGLCPTFYPDEMCRGNYSLHSYDPPLLYDLHSDPSEIYSLDVKEYSNVMKQIEMVWLQSRIVLYNIVKCVHRPVWLSVGLIPFNVESWNCNWVSETSPT